MSVAIVVAAVALVAGQTSQGAVRQVPVVEIPREESPWLVAALALPTDVAATDRVLLAALYETPEAWPAESPVRALRDRGGELHAEATPDGILIVAEGAARDGALVVAAARAPLDLVALGEGAISRAQGRVLRQRAADAITRGEQAARLALWRRWFDHQAPPLALEIDDIALHRRTPAGLAIAQREVAAAEGAVLIVEGRTSGLALSAGIDAGTAEEPLPAAVSPLVPVPGPVLSDVRAVVPTPTLVAGHPLPPGEVDPLVDALLVVGLLRSEEPRIAARVERSAKAALLILETPLAGRTPEVAHQALVAHLAAFRERLANRVEARALAAAAEQSFAHQAREIGDEARARAQRTLLGAAPPVTGSDAPATARAFLFPDALRGVIAR